MADRRVDRIERCLRDMEGRARFQQLLEAIRAEEGNPDLPYQAVYIAIQMENQRLEREGQRTKFVTSREGEKWGWVRLQEQNDAARSDAENQVEALINNKNESVGEEIRAWLQRMDWRKFESTFLTEVLQALGFQDAKITQPTRDGGADALVSYQRGIVTGKALIQAKHWKVRPVPVDEVQKLRGYRGAEDTAVIITTGRFTADAQNEAKKPWQNDRLICLIDGDTLVEICKQHGIGVKKVKLTEVLVLDPELTREPPGSESAEETNSEAVDIPPGESAPSRRRLRDEMLGDLSVDELAQLSGFALNTVRNYRGDPKKRKTLGDAIRSNAQNRARALQLVSERRALARTE